jgi:glyoxylase-like metal-dependent hydrolase (beta-lactamase superfamily II)
MAGDPTDTPVIVTARDGCFIRQAIDNMGWYDMGDYIIVVDALEDAPLEGEVMTAIADTIGDKPVGYVLNTHTHFDHVSLNGAFVERFGAEIVNQRTTTIDPDGRVFEAPGRKVCMIPMPGCHTREDCVIWAPDDGVLFVGDIFGWGLIPSGGLLNAELRKLLRDTYARLIAFDAKIVVPGHGPVCGTAELVRWIEYFDQLLETVADLVASGKSDDEIKASITPPDDMQSWWRFEAWKHADARSKVITSARRGVLDA